MGIQIKNLNKIYNMGKKNENHVLKNVCFTVEQGEMIAIIGKSGSGKSTLLHILGCLDTATDGEYVLDDVFVHEINEKSRADLRNRKIGFILQDFGLISDDSVIENVMLPMMFDETNMLEIKEKAKRALELVNMADLAYNKVSTLSGGEKQRTAIARALVKNPDYILADEPTGSLDTENAGILMKNLKKLNVMGKTIIMVTHDMELAKECERILTICDGELQGAEEETMKSMVESRG